MREKKYQIKLLLSLFSFLILNSIKAQIAEYEINKGWKFKQIGTLHWYEAVVPGCVHSDLLHNKLIADPFFRQNEKNLQWIDKFDWEYKSEFALSSDIISKTNCYLTFEGIDTYSTVWLNGVKIIETDNMFRSWRIDIKPYIKEKNTLIIVLKSPVTIGVSSMYNLGYSLPASNDQSENGGLGKNAISPFTRKAPYHYGWDWGPRFVTSGIWKPVKIVAWNNFNVNHIKLEQKMLTSYIAKYSATINYTANKNEEYNLKLFVDNSINTFEKILVQKGTHEIKIDFSIQNPKLWWTNGLGSQKIYNLDFAIEQKGVQLALKSEKIGIRKLRLVREKEKKSGSETFYFELNGRSIFAKGANYIPNDVFIPNVTPDRYEFIVKSAAEAGMNMLRVWGGGFYEKDIFYDLCDKYGILVWQDFMFSCSMYPGNKEFLENIKQEAIENIIRLRNHPCISLWCGNNEIEYAWAEGNFDRGWGWKEQYPDSIRKQIWSNYETIFYSILPEVVSKYTDNQPYWHSSPSQAQGVLANSSGDRGDVHYWGVWHGEEPIENYNKNKARFMSEYGFQSFPLLNSIKNFTIPEDWNINSDVMNWHQRSPIGNKRIKAYMEQNYIVPNEFEDFLYVNQLLQAEAIKTAIKAHRRNMPFCQGSLYWQLNDCWPAASWSSIDYFLQWKALHYFAKDAFKNQIVSTEINDNKINFHVVSDLYNNRFTLLKLNIMDFNGRNIWNRTIKFKMPENDAKLVETIYFKELPIDYIKDKVVLIATLVVNDVIVDREISYLVKPKDLKLPFADIEKSIRKKGNTFYIELKSNKLCKNVMLINENENIYFSNNFFDLLPNERVIITCNSSLQKESFEKGLKIVDLFKTMK